MYTVRKKRISTKYYARELPRFTLPGRPRTAALHSFFSGTNRKFRPVVRDRSNACSFFACLTACGQPGTVRTISFWQLADDGGVRQACGHLKLDRGNFSTCRCALFAFLSAPRTCPDFALFAHPIVVVGVVSRLEHVRIYKGRGNMCGAHQKKNSDGTPTHGFDARALLLFTYGKLCHNANRYQSRSDRRWGRDWVGVLASVAAIDGHTALQMP